MWQDWVSNPGPLTYGSGTLTTALRGLAQHKVRYDNERILISKAKR